MKINVSFFSQNMCYRDLYVQTALTNVNNNKKFQLIDMIW